MHKATFILSLDFIALPYSCHDSIYLLSPLNSTFQVHIFHSPLHIVDNAKYVLISLCILSVLFSALCSGMNNASYTHTCHL